MNVKVEKLIVYWEEKNVTNLSGEKSFGVLELRVLQYLRKNSIITAYCMLFATHSCFTIMLADTRPCFEYENPRPLLIKAVKINRTQIFIIRGPRSVGLALAGLS